MWNTEIYCLLGLALIVPAYGAATENNVRSLKSCNVTILKPQCGVNERCIQNGGKELCDCIKGYERLNENCVPKPPPEVLPTDTTTVKDNPQPTSGGGNSVAAGLLIPTFLIVLGVLIFFGARRYKWVQRFREYRQNRYGNVLVTRDDDDDDPPIA